MSFQDGTMRDQVSSEPPSDVSLSDLNMVIIGLLHPVGRSSPPGDGERANLEQAISLLEQSLGRMIKIATCRNQQEGFPMPEVASEISVVLPSLTELHEAVMTELHGVYDDPCWADYGDIIQRLQRAIMYVRQSLDVHYPTATDR